MQTSKNVQLTTTVTPLDHFAWLNHTRRPCLLPFELSNHRPDEGLYHHRAGTLKPKMPLPLPTLSFTIPSIHDDTVLQCRVYHPACLSPTRLSQITTWNKKAAIVAHPYAVLGGCYDDPVVDLVSSTILEQGFLVGTFNFRSVSHI
jgi:hypothetical protein